MADWEGRMRVSAKLGRPVIVDEWAFPRQVEVTFEGEGDAPDLAARFEYGSAGPTCVSLSVNAKPGGRPVTNADQQWINVDALAEMAFARVAWLPTPDGASHVLRAGDAKVEAEAADVVRQSRKDDRLVRVARVYLTAYPKGAPRVVVAETLDVSRRTANYWIKQARDEGLIPPQGSDDAEYAAALDRLTRDEQPRGRTNDEVKNLLSRARKGDL
jgi:transposase-like protein